MRGPIESLRLSRRSFPKQCLMDGSPVRICEGMASSELPFTGCRFSFRGVGMFEVAGSLVTVGSFVG